MSSSKLEKFEYANDKTEVYIKGQNHIRKYLYWFYNKIIIKSMNI